jgi:hypothetical protein
MDILIIRKCTVRIIQNCRGNCFDQCRGTLKIEAEFSFETLINAYHSMLHLEPRHRGRCSELAMRWASKESCFNSM